VLEQVLRPPGPIDLGLTLGPFSRGGSDPTMRIEAGRVVRATRTPDGPATGEFVASGDDVVVLDKLTYSGNRANLPPDV